MVLDGAKLQLDGTFDGADVSIAMTRVPDERMPLLHPRLRWMRDAD